MKYHFSYARGIIAGILLFCGLSISVGTAIAHETHEHSVGGDETIDQLNQEIQNKKAQIDEIESQKNALDTQIEEVKSQGATLENQIHVLSKQIESTELDIQQTSEEISTVSLEIQRTEEEIAIQENNISKQKRVLAAFLQDLYKTDRSSTLEILLENTSLSSFLDAQHASELIEREAQQTLDDIQELTSLLQEHRQEQSFKRDELDRLKNKLDEERLILDQERDGQEYLLAETESQEAKYEALLTQAKKEQEEINAEVAALESDVRAALERQRTAGVDLGFVPGDGTLGWPVYPTHGISAFFHDPGYVRYFGVDHYALDIPAPQGTAIHAPADAYVVKYRDNGLGYSYILLDHGNGLSTLYGHVSASYVSEGDVVRAGDVIGLVGGTPGTRGAGWRTTGPHLHFETRMNGTLTDPLPFLPGY